MAAKNMARDGSGRHTGKPEQHITDIRKQAHACHTHQWNHLRRYDWNKKHRRLCESGTETLPIVRREGRYSPDFEKTDNNNTSKNTKLQ